MSARTVSFPKVPEVRLLPPQKAYDYEYWARRLIQPELLLGAVAVAIFQAPLLAVPTGAARQGGQLHMGAEVFAQQAALALEGLPGFEQLSYSGPIVEWGDKRPAHCRPDQCHQFYGLRDPAEEPTGHTWPPAGHRGHGSGTGRWPPAPEQPPGWIPLLRETVPAVAATALP
ncbi:DUF6302 family protein (plasmid) [Streptomyces sp. NBC_01456]|uniref:DUF6302 family protein n=1 Tax=unclassified Streptomyces TaxID=2593676 RepID=UPI002E2FF571|nr:MULTISPECIES: DUF6302 family protein [unclassified Streptomyces]